MLVDDHAVVRVGFRLLLGASGDIEVVAEADCGEVAYQTYDKVAPDVVVMDLSMPGMGGIETVRRLLARDRHARVLVLSAHDDGAHARRAMTAGARGYLSKRTAPDVLIDAVRAIHAGDVYIDPAIAALLNSKKSALESLTEREFAVFIQLASGQSATRIAELMNLSPNTIGSHLYNIKQKLGVGNQAELTLIALRNGLLDETA